MSYDVVKKLPVIFAAKREGFTPRLYLGQRKLTRYATGINAISVDFNCFNGTAHENIFVKRLIWSRSCPLKLQTLMCLAIEIT